MKFEIRRFDGEDKIFIEDQLFDWGLDESSIDQVNKIQNLDELQEIHKDIRNFFLSCLSDILGRQVTIKEVYEGLLSGEI